MELGTEDDDDEVAYEFPVDLVHASRPSQLYILKHSSRPPNAELGLERAIVAARYKPIQKKVEIDMYMFPKSVAPKLEANGLPPALAPDPDQYKRIPFSLRDSYDELEYEKYEWDGVTTIESTEAEPLKSNYALLSIQDERATLACVDAILNIRPSLRKVDEYDAAQTAVATAALQHVVGGRGGTNVDSTDASGTSETEGGYDSTVDQQEGMSTIDITFKKKESERAIERRKSSHHYLKQRSEAEPWTILEYYSSDTDVAEYARKSLLKPVKVKDEGLPAATDSIDGFTNPSNLVCPGPIVRSVSGLQFQPNAEYMDSLAHRSGGYDQYANPNRPVALVADIGDGTPTGPSAGFPIDNRPEIITDFVSNHDLRNMSLSRLVPLVLQRVRVINVPMLLRLIRKSNGLAPFPPAPELIPMLVQHAVHVRDHCWVIKANMAPAGSIRRPGRYMAARDLVISLFRGSEPVVYSEAEKKLRQFSFSQETIQQFLNEAGDFQPGIRKWVFRYDLEKDIEYLSPEEQQEISMWMEANAAFMEQEEQRQAAAWNDRLEKGISSLQKSAAKQQGPAKHLVPSFLRLQYSQYGVLTKELLQAVLLKDVPAGLAGMSESQILDIVMVELKAMSVEIRDRYVLKTLNNPQTDKYRDVIIELYKNQEQVRRSDAREAMLKSDLSEDIPDAIYMKLMKELAISKGNSWVLKHSESLTAPAAIKAEAAPTGMDISM